MDNARMELEQKIAAAGSPEEIKRILNDAGAKIGPEDAAHLWEEIKKGKEQDGRELSRDELEAVSGGKDRNWVTDGCAATVDYDSWCGSDDWCNYWDVTYDFEPTATLCPNCGKNMYFQDMIYNEERRVSEFRFRCKFCGCVKYETCHS